MVKGLSVGSGLDSLGFSLILVAVIVTCGWSPYCNYEKIQRRTG